MISIRFNQRYQTKLRWIKDLILLFLNSFSGENVKKVEVREENCKKYRNKCRRWGGKLLSKVIIIKSKYKKYKNKPQRQKIKNKKQMNKYSDSDNSSSKKWMHIIKSSWMKSTVVKLRWRIHIMLIILD